MDKTLIDDATGYDIAGDGKYTENERSIQFLFDMSKEVKEFYESPVIFVTKRDYSDPIFNAMCEIRTLLRNESEIDKNDLINIIVEYHLNWLRIIKEIENFKKSAKNISREHVFETVSYTIDTIGERLKYYQRYMTKYRSGLSNSEQINLLSDMEIVEEMHREVVNLLLEKLECFKSYLSDEEFLVKINCTVEHLCAWVDKIHDNLSILICKHLNINLNTLVGDLANILQEIVADLNNSSDTSAAILIAELKTQGNLSAMVQCTASRNLEINKLIEKIALTDERIKRLKNETTTAAVLALQHKKEYLEERLESLEKMKISLSCLSNINVAFSNEFKDLECGKTCKDFYQVRIFNHILPEEERVHLITRLIEVWNAAVFGNVQNDKSIISILSPPLTKEVFHDELGNFYIDENSRKIYKKPGDKTLYQCNDKNELVPLTDDDHIYFYDDCGRYYTDHKKRQRVYKATNKSSEYMIESTGTLLKVKEERDGVTFYYNKFGRYYIDENGKNIYREPDSLSEYENDGLGNLVRIRNHLDTFNFCPDDTNVTADFKYLEGAVGLALRKCVAQVVMIQPEDPVKCLSSLLQKYRANMEAHEQRLVDERLMEVEKDIIRAEERAEAERRELEHAFLAQQAGSEASYESNFSDDY